MSAALSRLVRHWLIAAMAVSVAMLATAHAFETFGGLSPCTLCLRQREVYWVALAVAAAGAAVELTPVRARLRGLACAVLALIFLTGAGVAVYHAGAEWKWWPGPSTCSGAHGGATASAMAALLRGAKIAAPRCDEAAWRWLGLSMAGWNAAISLGLAALSALAAIRNLSHDRS